MDRLDDVRRRIQAARRITVLTGAGVSAASGVPTFRGAGGLWKNRQAQQLATPEAFRDDPALVWEWYAWRRQVIAGCEPNAAHRTIARWSGRDGFTLITQNVDGLHERAGTRHVVRYHGSIWRLRCTAADGRLAADDTEYADKAGSLAADHTEYADKTGRLAADHTEYADKTGRLAADHTEYADKTGSSAADHTEYADKTGSLAADHTEYADKAGRLAADRTEYADKAGRLAADHTEYADKAGSLAADRTEYADKTGRRAADYTESTDTHAAEWEDLRVPLEPLPPTCPRCGALARPGVVWFGEAIPPDAARAAQAAAACDVFLSIGTSAVVYPAAGLVADARARGAFTVEINPETTATAVDVALAMAAEVALPLLDR